MTASLGMAVWSLGRRDVVRFVRQRSRIVGALGTPMVFWLLIGSGFGSSVRVSPGDASGHFLEFAFPGTLALITLFTAIFSTISVIEDRQAGFLQGVLVAPVGRSAIVWGKLLGSTTLAVAQGMVFLVFAPWSGIELSVGAVARTALSMTVLGVGLSGLGFLLAWSLDSTQGFHAIMNLLLMPMWMLSGALFPAEGAANWVRWIIAINPMTYGVAAIRESLMGEVGRGAAAGPGFAVSLGVCALFAAVMVVWSLRMVRRST